MHIDYVREVVEYHEENFDDHNFSILKSLSPEPEVMRVAESFGDEKINGICRTMREAQKSRYKKITDKQRLAITNFLLEKLKTARAVLARAFGMTEAEMFGENIGAESVQMHPTLRVGYGLLADFVADKQKQEKGITYRASSAAIRATKRGEGTITVQLQLGGETVAVTQEEAKTLGLAEAEAEASWYQPTVTGQDIAAVAMALRRKIDTSRGRQLVSAHRRGGDSAPPQNR